jgi:hypothetical protein
VSAIKSSPFLLTEESLERLKQAACNEPAVLDLVGYYQRAASDTQEFADMISEEMDHFGVR